MNSADWDYEADLVLLRTKLRQASGVEKDDLRNLMQVALTLNGNKGGSTPQNVEQASGSEILSDDSNLNSSMTEKMTWLWLLNQFQKHFRYRDRDGRASNLTRSLYKTQTSTLNDTGSGSRRPDKEISWEDLQLAWTTFEPYLKKVLSRSKERNPFKNDVIIREVLQYLPRKELLKCRLINKTWNQNGIHVYYKNPDHVCSVKDLTEFSPDIALALNFPLSIFKRISISLDKNKAEDCNTFFSKVGTQIKDLKISEPYPCKNTKFQSSCFEYQVKLRMVFQNVPELESLKLSNLPESVVSQPFVLTSDELKTRCNLPNVHTLGVDVERKQDFCQEFINGLLSMVPNVKKYQDRGFDNSSLPLLTAVTGNFQLHTLFLGNSEAVRAKDFCARMKDQKLKNLEVRLLLRDEEDVQACEAFFTSQSDTLEWMTVEISCLGGAGVKVKLPFMKTLNHMELEYKDSCIQPFQSKNIPCLRKLNTNCLNNMEAFLVNDEFSSVQELVFDYFYLDYFDPPNVEQLRRIGTTFPNLRKLKIQSIALRDDGFPVVFSLSQLEELHLIISEAHLEKNINYTLSGLPVESAWLISQLTAAKLPLISSLERTQASLQTLTGLKQLTLEFKSRHVKDPNLFVIDEVGVHFGFLSMPRLQQLKLLGDFTISEDGAAELKKFHYSVKIAPNHIIAKP